MKFSSIINRSKWFQPTWLEHYRILRKLRVGTKKDIYKTLSLTTLTVLFEAGGIALVLPILSFIRNDRDTVKFANDTDFGRYVVEAFSYVHVPLNLFTLSSCVIAMITMRQALNYFYTLRIDYMKIRVGRDLSLSVFKAILGSTPENISNYRAGQFAILVQHECQAAASIVRNYARIWSLLLTFAIYLYIMFLMSVAASIAAMVMIGGLLVALGKFVKIVRILGEKRIQVRSNYVSFLNERFRAWKLIKTAGTLAFERETTREYAQKDFDTEYAVTRTGGLVQLILTPVAMFMALSALYISVEYMSIEMDLMIMFMIIIIRLVPAAQNLNGQRIQLANFDPALRLVERALDQSRSAKEEIRAGKDVPSLRTEIRFENVSFSYPGKKDLALKNISASFPAGKITAIVGHSGAGKSTLIDLILRLYRPTAGRILYDGTPIDEFDLAAFRHRIVCMTQELFLFRDTIAENIRYMNRSATGEEIVEASQFANADDFINDLPNGYETYLGESGAGLSGGEKQRIALARVFLSGADIIILDEPTGALDYQSERKIQNAIKGIVKRFGITVIIIAHRHSTIENADLVLHLSKGQLIHEGTPEDVLSTVPSMPNEAQNAQ